MIFFNTLEECILELLKLLIQKKTNLVGIINL